MLKDWPSLSSYSYNTGLLTGLLASQEEPQGTCQEGGGIGATGEAYQHSKGEVANSLATEKEDGNNRKQGGTNSINAAAHGLPNAVINHGAETFATTMNLQILADAVKDYDGTIDGITYYGQQRRYEGGIHFHLEQGEVAQGYRYVNNQGDDGRNGKLKLKAQGDVGYH